MGHPVVSPCRFGARQGSELRAVDDLPREPGDQNLLFEGKGRVDEAGCPHGFDPQAVPCVAVGFLELHLV
eukprot:2504711-Amphidinium_carterae.3